MIWRGPKIKSGAVDLTRRPIADKFLNVALVPIILSAYQISTFYLSFRDRKGVPKFNAGLLAHRRTSYAETFVCGPSIWQDQTVCQISASYIVKLCEYVFAVGYPNWFLGDFEGADVKLLCSNPNRHHPAWTRVSWCIKCQNRFTAAWPLNR